MSFAIPRAFPGGTIVVMASGPSMSGDVAKKIRDSGRPAIVVNTTFRLAPWAWMLYAADWRWWKSHPDGIRFQGMKVSIEANDPQVRRLRNTGIDGFDADPSCVRTGNNSGYQAVHCAMHTGAARILLTGFDMDGGHWHGANVGGVRRDWIARFPALRDAARERGVEIINCTPKSALKVFPMMALEGAI